MTKTLTLGKLTKEEATLLLETVEKSGFTGNVVETVADIKTKLWFIVNTDDGEE